ncbi:MAG: corrinoid protein [Fimbriimonadaceae bacterium]|jgi:5-methyltetrahydrofolate--homocysteine methyltransferase|nr:corrinoid protein [Fimbriimonadaceae bacterium]
MDTQLLTSAIVAGNRKDAKALTEQALAEGLPPQEVLDSLIAGMDEIGGKFQRNEAFVPEMLIAARAMKEAMAVLEPVLLAAGIKPEFTAVIGTVQGDLHDIGKNLVAMMWRGANFSVVDLGTNVPPEKFVEAAREHQADLVGLSALLTTTMPSMKATIEALRSAELPKAKVMIGGAPITPEFAKEIGADGFAADAASAVTVARELVAG